MVKGVSGPGGQVPQQDPKQVETGMTKMYTAAKAPGFKQMLEHWFPGQVTNKMVTSFEQGVMKMITNSLKKAEAQHKKIQQEIKARIKEG